MIENINAVILEYQNGNKDALTEDIYESLKTYCLRVISKVCKKYINSDNEEALIVNEVMLKALDSFKSNNDVPFKIYFAQIVKNKIIDLTRKKSYNMSVPFSYYLDDKYFMNSYVYEPEVMTDAISLSMELEKLDEILSEYNISWFNVIKEAPKHIDSKRMIQNIASLIVNDDELRNILLSKKQLPKSLINQKYNVNMKMLERNRKYIITVVLILIHNTSIKSYLLCA